MVDPATVATAVSGFLVQGAAMLGERIWEKSADATADGAAGFGQRLLARLLHHSEELSDGEAGGAMALPQQSGVLVAVHDVVAAPQDADAQAALRVALRKLLAADPGLLDELAQMVRQEAPAQQTGHRSVVIGGSQSGGINVTGDANRFGFGS